MFWRMIRNSLLRQKKKMGLIVLTIMLGTSLSVAMLSIMLDVGDEINKELKTYGANINVVSKDASLLGDIYGVEEGEGVSDKFLNEDDITKLKTIFWAYNIVDFTPYLSENLTITLEGDDVKDTVVKGTWFNKDLSLPTGETVTTGMKNLKTWWTVEGDWPDDESNEALVGDSFAKEHGLKVGDTVSLNQGTADSELKISGVFHSGGDEDKQIFIPLLAMQKLIDKEGLVGNIEVSAITTPDNELSRRAAKNPQLLSIKDWETWYCTAYVSSISYQIEEVITNSKAKVIRQVAESEGVILNKTQLLMFLITIISIIGSILGISSIVTTNIIERSQEIGLLKAVGASNLAITRRILTEIFIAGLFGGVLGYGLGYGFAQIIGQSVFNTSITIKPMVIPLVICIVFVVTIGGSIQAIRMLLALKPAEVLHGR